MQKRRFQATKVDSEVIGRFAYEDVRRFRKFDIDDGLHAVFPPCKLWADCRAKDMMVYDHFKPYTHEQTINPQNTALVFSGKRATGRGGRPPL